MKQLQEFEKWADSICEASASADTKPLTREIPKERDIYYQASRAHPEVSAEQALGLFLADKIEDFDRRDLQQNKIINAQRRENEKLRGNLSKIQQDLSDVESSGKQTDAEIDRLRKLSGTLQTDVQQRRVSKDEVEKVLSQVEELKNKSGLPSEEYTKIKDQVENLRKEKVDPREFEKFTKLVSKLSAQDQISAQNLQDIASMSDVLSAQQQELTTQKGNVAQQLSDLAARQADLEKKEERQSQEIKQQVDAEVTKIKQETRKRAASTKRKNETWKTQLSNRIEDVEISDINQNNILNRLNLLSSTEDTEEIESEPSDGDYPTSVDSEPDTKQQQTKTPQWSTDKTNWDLNVNGTDDENPIHPSNGKQDVPYGFDDDDNKDIKEMTIVKEYLDPKLVKSLDIFRDLPKDRKERFGILKKVRNLAITIKKSFDSDRAFGIILRDHESDDIIDAMVLSFLKIGRQSLLKTLADKSYRDDLYPWIHYYLKQIKYRDGQPKLFKVLIVDVQSLRDTAQTSASSQPDASARSEPDTSTAVPSPATLVRGDQEVDFMTKSVNEMINHIIGEQVTRWIK